MWPELISGSCTLCATDRLFCMLSHTDDLSPFCRIEKNDGKEASDLRVHAVGF